MLYKTRTPEAKWIAVIDDDTFFLSMSALVKMLTLYDEKEDQDIGGISEDWNTVNLYGMMAFGAQEGS